MDRLADQNRDAGFASQLLIVSRLVAITTIVVGLVVCCGWALDRPDLRSLFPGFPEMKLNAAIAFVLAGASLGLQIERRRLPTAAGRICAILVAIIGLLSFAQYAVGADFGIDQLLMEDRSGDGPHPGRIPLMGAINLFLLGSALLFLDADDREGRWAPQWPALIVAFISFVVILGYAYEVSSLYRARASAPVALHGAILFVLLALGALFARSDRGLMKRVHAADAGGMLIRRLLPAAILVPPVIGWLRLQGEQAGLYGVDFGLALYATANMTIFSALIWNTATVVQRADAERRAAESKLKAQMARLDLLNHITRAIGERQDLRSIFQVVVRSLEDHLSIDFGCIALHEPSEDLLTVESVGRRSGDFAAELAMTERSRVPIQGNGLARCMGECTLVYEPDVAQTPLPFPQRFARAGLKSLVIAPLPAESRVVGVLVAARIQASAFSSTDCEFLRQLSEHIGLATHQAQLYGALHQAYNELRQSQQTVLQQERLRALGQMASGIAHDINNALSPISLYTESLLEREEGLSAVGREHLRTIHRAVDDVSGTVARMREFYRQREPQLHLKPIDLNLLAGQIIQLTRARWRDLPQERGVVIDLRTDLASSLPAVLGVETEIRDAITNLIFNAVDAMPQGGVLTIRTRALGVPEQASVIERATRVCLEVCDTGTGMDPETQRRCLEPFFTTKGERGTGLGLAMVYGMAQRHSGELEIDSTLGIGTCVRLIFPSGATETSPDDQTPAPRAPTRRLRLLIVDDDPLILESLRHTLERDGHVVAIADGGQAGIDAFAEKHRCDEPFDAVITDLGMPYVDGRKVASAIRGMAPAVPIILLTGWGQRLLSTNDIPAAVNRVLPKPPKLEELRRALAVLTNADT